MLVDPNGALNAAVDGMHDLARMARQANATTDEWIAYARQLEQRIRDLELALAVEKAHSGGLTVQAEALKRGCPSNPALADSGQRFKKSGNIKSVSRLAYEREFDRIARDARISDPTKYRAD